ncbi:MAG: hypothetical protein ABIT01_21365 [Thermoanaerobaculia bacterium]
MKRFGRQEGLPSENGMTVARGTGGGDLGREPTVDGLALVDARKESRNQLPPPVRIEEFLVGGRLMSAEKELSLAADARNVEIRFTALSFKRPEKVRFRTRLWGLDDE